METVGIDGFGISIVIIVASVGVTAVLAYRLRKQKSIFKSLVAGYEQRNRASASLSPNQLIPSLRLLELQEAERRHLARELHDEVGQLLTGLRLLLRPGDSLTHPAKDQLEQARAVVDKLLDKIRGLSFDLRPAVLDHLGLVPALLELFENYTRQTGVLVSFKHKDVEKRFAFETETTAYRIVQEALTNVARHAGVPAVTVRVWAVPGVLNIQVEDKGRGFDPKVVLTATQSSGLPGMRERVMLLNGCLTIDSMPGEGVQITAELPLGLVPGEVRR